MGSRHGGHLLATLGHHDDTVPAVAALPSGDAPGALVVVEEATGAELTLPAGLTLIEERDYGDTRVVFARAA